MNVLVLGLLTIEYMTNFGGPVSCQYSACNKTN
nr:MAG TPA: hypothetical protein [Caudoviricetes sp.]